MPAFNAAAIETRGLVKRFGEVVAVDALDLAVPDHGVYGFLGPNGAGKNAIDELATGKGIDQATLLALRCPRGPVSATASPPTRGLGFQASHRAHPSR
jgi:ABC-type hemin transport system ATPase subunit